MNKGVIYNTALAPDAARGVPCLFITGGKKMQSRTNAIKGIYEMNSRFGAVCCCSNDPLMAHDEGTSLQLALIFCKMLVYALAATPKKIVEYFSSLSHILTLTWVAAK
ncbi:hypothetical protein ACFQZI_06200 [Mucilaginibacter lutimaris]|uniref:Uncharacterized protein n=1 Tax=Mucilaginibacter lutimaris TaxID=931629 RepID=A0ABW2ZE26_9SPHI